MWALRSLAYSPKGTNGQKVKRVRLLSTKSFEIWIDSLKFHSAFSKFNNFNRICGLSLEGRSVPGIQCRQWCWRSGNSQTKPNAFIRHRHRFTCLSTSFSCVLNKQVRAIAWYLQNFGKSIKTFAHFTFCTFFSEPSLPVACPFHDAYHFIYNNNTGGFCSSPASYTHTCASDSQFHFQFRQCTDAAYTHNLGENKNSCFSQTSMVACLGEENRTGVNGADVLQIVFKKKGGKGRFVCRIRAEINTLLHGPSISSWTLKCSSTNCGGVQVAYTAQFDIQVFSTK